MLNIMLSIKIKKKYLMNSLQNICLLFLFNLIHFYHLEGKKRKSSSISDKEDFKHTFQPIFSLPFIVMIGFNAILC